MKAGASFVRGASTLAVVAALATPREARADEKPAAGESPPPRSSARLRADAGIVTGRFFDTTTSGETFALGVGGHAQASRSVAFEAYGSASFATMTTGFGLHVERYTLGADANVLFGPIFLGAGLQTGPLVFHRVGARTDAPARLLAGAHAQLGADVLTTGRVTFFLQARADADAFAPYVAAAVTGGVKLRVF